MSVRLSDIVMTTDGQNNIVRLQVTGRLTAEDYNLFVPQIEDAIRQHGCIRIVFDMQDFHGWTFSAMWQDVKFDLKHFRNIERIAIIGDKAWEHGMAIFCQPFTSATIRYFDRSEVDEVEAWIQLED
ncbi:MAG: STAS/SEC14 domain-containing protein [Fuerstiella sp.]